MSAVIIRQLLEEAALAVDPTFATAWENVIFVPVSGTPYQQVVLMLATPQNPTFSNQAAPDFTREIGYLQITLHYPQGAGPKDAYAKAQALRAVFFQGKTFTSGNITVIISGTPAIAPGRVDGDRWSIPVKIPFFANVYG